MTPAIVILAYKRPIALKRLLNAIEAAEYQNTPTLVISLEGESHPEVVEIANKFRSKKLTVRVVQRQIRIGLREHVIACGDLTEEYGSVIILEDDILVDRFFYQYASAALKYYKNEEKIAGIALYSYEHNEFAKLAFTPMFNGYDTYLMQVACSWGQCWTREQWASFMTWYLGKTQADLDGIKYLPSTVKCWPESSWKKYYHAYMIVKDKFFVYPYFSYSTNCSDIGGTHSKSESSQNQVSMPAQFRSRPNFNFCPELLREIIYDSYMEPCGEFIFRAIGKAAEEIEVDIYGTKPIQLLMNKPFALTIKDNPHKIQSYSYRFRPHEFNLLHPSINNGGDFWLCKSVFLNGANRKNIKLLISRYCYYFKANLLARDVLMSVLLSLPRKIFSKILKKKI